MIEFKDLHEIQLTHNAEGHFLNQRQAFSPDDQFLVFDNRNVDSKIGENATIQMVDIQSQEIKTIYSTKNQTEFGPGVGAVSFHPTKNQVVFIHGLTNSAKDDPYGFTRRFAMKVNLGDSMNYEPLEARDVKTPFTKGALRGGSHAYSYSADGKLLSFTYNDLILEKESLSNPEVKDLRTVGAFLLDQSVSVVGSESAENFSGTGFAVLLAKVIASPTPASDEINKAYEECWVGENGYLDKNGNRQPRALAYLGDVISVKGEKVTEIFVSDIPENLADLISSVDAGSTSKLPSIPKGVKQRRLTFTTQNTSPGVQGPRQWLRTSPDGSAIYFYQKDEKGIVQICSVSPNGGIIQPITDNSFSPDTDFSLSSDGKYVAFGSNESLFVSRIADGMTYHISRPDDIESTDLSNFNWSNTGYKLSFNRKVIQNKNPYYQIFMLDLSGKID